MSKTHNHLSLEERAVMQVMLDHGCSLRAIARKLRRSASTISRGYLCSPPPSQTFSSPDSGLGLNRVLKVDVLGHQAGRLKMADPAVHGFIDEVVGHARLHLAGLHR